MAKMDYIVMDIGATHLRIRVDGRNEALDFPVAAVINQDVLMSVGESAHRLIGRAPQGVEIVRPLENGILTHENLLRQILAYHMNTIVGRRMFSKPRALVSIAGKNIKNNEQRAVLHALIQTGARRAQVFPGVMAAAVGAGVNIHESTGRLVVEMGGATSHAAVIAKGKMEKEERDIIGGDEFTRAIRIYVQKKYNLDIGMMTAQRVKHTIGTLRQDRERDFQELVAGKSLFNELPKQMKISSSELAQAMEEPFARFCEALRSFIASIPDQYATDVMTKGIVLTGGGANLAGLDAEMEKVFHTQVTVAPRPEMCVVIGLERVLENIDEYSEAIAMAQKLAK